MSRALAIPTTAPFSAEDVEMLNRVVGPASAVQRAWLAGFFALLITMVAGGIEITLKEAE